MPRHAAVVRVIVGRFEAHLAVLEHFEQLVHLDRVQLADFVEEEDAAVRARNRAWLGLRHAVIPQRPRALIDRIVHAAQQRVGDGALIEAHARRVHLDKRRVGAERRAGRLLRTLHHQPRRARFTDTGRAVDDHVLRIRAAQNRAQRANALLLPDDILERLRPHAFRQRFGQPDCAHARQLVHLPARASARPLRRDGRFHALLLHPAQEIDPDDQAHAQLNTNQYRHAFPSFSDTP